MKTKLTTIFGVLLGLSLLAAACGGSDSDSGSGSPADQELIAAVAAEMQSEGDVPPGVDTDCMAAAMVNGLGGAENIEQEYGLTVESINAGDTEALDEVLLPADEARELASGMLDCGLGEFMVESLAGEGVSGDDAECLLGNLDGDLIRDIMAVEFMAPEDAAEIESSAFTELLGGITEAAGECDLDLASLGS